MAHKAAAHVTVVAKGQDADMLVPCQTVVGPSWDFLKRQPVHFGHNGQNGVENVFKREILHDLFRRDGCPFICQLPVVVCNVPIVQLVFIFFFVLVSIVRRTTGQICFFALQQLAGSRLGERLNSLQ